MRTLKTKKPIELVEAYPLDIRSYYKSYNEAYEFANNSPVAYEGEIISVKMANEKIMVFSLEKNKEETGGNFKLVPVGDHVAFKYVDVLPTKDIEDIIYILSTNNIGYIFKDPDWIELIYPKTDIIDSENPSDKKLTSEKAVKEFVEQKISEAGDGNDSRYVTNITYNKESGQMDIIKPKSSSSFVLDGLMHNPEYNKDTRTFKFPIFGLDTPLTVTLGKDIFIDPTKNNRYNPETGNIELYLNDGTMITLPARDLVDVYTAGNTDTILTSIDNNVVTSNLRISNKPNNALKIIPRENEDTQVTYYGLFVEDKNFQPNIDEALLLAKEYTDDLKTEINGSLDIIRQSYKDADINTLEEAKRYSDTLIKNFTFITQNSITLSFETKENESIYQFPPDISYNTTTDVLELYINGAKQSIDVINKRDSTSIEFTTLLPAGYKVDLKITKLDMATNTLKEE